MSMSISCGRLRPGVRRRPRRVRAAALRRARREPALPAHARRGRALPPARPARCSPSRRRRRRPCASSSPPDRFSRLLRRHFMTPLVAAVWSTAPTQAGDYPARYLFAFLANHGMLQVTGSPTVVHGRRRIGALRRAGGEGPDRRRRRRPRSARSRRVGRRRRGPRRRRRGRTTSTASSSPPTRDQALRMLAAPTARRARGCSARSATRSTRPCCTPTPRCCRGRRAPRRPGTTRCPPCDADPTACRSATT